MGPQIKLTSTNASIVATEMERVRDTTPPCSEVQRQAGKEVPGPTGWRPERYKPPPARRSKEFCPARNRHFCHLRLPRARARRTLPRPSNWSLRMNREK